MRTRSAEALELKQLPEKAPRALGHDHGARLGQLLKASGKVRRLAGNRLLLCLTTPDQVADHDEAGGDAHPGSKHLSVACPEPADRCRHREPGPHRPLAGILVRPRPAEEGEHAVAHELGDMPTEARDLGRDRVVVGREEFAKLLGVELSRKRG